MEMQEIKLLAQRLLSGELPLEQFVAQLGAAGGPTAELKTATIDLDRRRRCGYPEVVFGQGKSVEMLTEIFQTILDSGEEVLSTRIEAAKAEPLQAAFPEARYNPLARTVRIGEKADRARLGRVAVATAGTSDLPVAEEARETLDWMGVEAWLIQDIGVAGPQRLLARVEDLRRADAVVVAAGMEGALPSVVAGHVACPVIGVPTSVGYGASFGGVAALLSMLNSCAANVAVVNIDAGFKAGFLAGQIARGKYLGADQGEEGQGR